MSQAAMALATLGVLLLTSSACSDSSTPGSRSGGMMPAAGSAGDGSSGGGSGVAGADTGGSTGLDGAGISGSGGASSAGASGSAGDAARGGSGAVSGETGESGGTAGAGGGAAGSGGTSTAAGLDCAPTGSVSYTLVRNSQPISAEAAAYALITAAMDLAVSYYNCYTDLSLELEVHFDATFAIVETDGTTIRFGAMDAMNPVTAMHEIAGIAGVGSPEFAALVEDGVFTGEHATAELRAITGDETATLFADAEHFWPYGLNYPNEVKALSDLENHCRLVVAIRKDLGL